MDVAVDAAAGGKKRAQARPKAQGLQTNRPCSTSGRRHPAKLRHSQCSFYATLNAGFTLASSARRSLIHPTTELPGFRDMLFTPGLCRKNRSILKLDSGTQFPLEGRSGKRHPALGPKSGTQFPPRAAKGRRVPFRASNQDAFRYPRSHISANEINLVSPLLAAASWHPCVKPRFEKIA